MFEKIDVLRLSQAMASHAGQRQVLSARNIANADTPGYRAADMPGFAETYRSTTGLKATRAGHLGATTTQADRAQIDPRGSIDPNGNSVSLEREMLRSVEIRQQHDLALSIYRSSLGILRSSLGRGV